MSKDYRQSHDYELEDEYRKNPNDEDVYRELNNRGYEEVDGELLDEYEYADYKEERERRNVRGKEESGGGIFSSVFGILIIVFIIGLFVDAKTTMEIVVVILSIIAYGVLKIIEAIF